LKHPLILLHNSHGIQLGANPLPQPLLPLSGNLSPSERPLFSLPSPTGGSGTHPHHSHPERPHRRPSCAPPAAPSAPVCRPRCCLCCIDSPASSRSPQIQPGAYPGSSQGTQDPCSAMQYKGVCGQMAEVGRQR
jgi:hypothetical protein